MSECFDASKIRVGRATDAELDELPIVQRNVFVAYVHNGASYEAISEYFGIPVGTVRSRLHRARKKIAGIRDTAGKVSDDAIVEMTSRDAALGPESPTS